MGISSRNDQTISIIFIWCCNAFYFAVIKYGIPMEFFVRVNMMNQKSSKINVKSQ